MSEQTLFIYGRHPVEEILTNEPNRVDKLYLKEGIQPRFVQVIQELASNNRIPVKFVQGKKIHELVGAVSDQGVVAQLSGVPYTEFEEWLELVDMSTKPAILLLDEIEDPQNFGAILRTAAATGIHAVLVPKHRQSPVNAAVFKTSAGTAGKVPIVRVTNMNQAIDALKEHGFWFAALDTDGDKPLWEADFDSPMGFVVGNEGAGVRQKTLEHCDFRLRIPMQNKVESLNASVSAALICYEWMRSKHR